MDHKTTEYIIESEDVGWSEFLVYDNFDEANTVLHYYRNEYPCKNYRLVRSEREVIG